MLDRSIKRTIEKADGSRPVIPHSGVWPHLPRLDGTDSHLYFGWYHGDERDLPGFAAALPRMVRFVSEFGAQAVPETDAFLEPERWPDLDWERLEATTACSERSSTAGCPRPTTPPSPTGGPPPRRYQATVIAPPRREAAPAEVPADRWLPPVPPHRRPAGGVVVACSTTTGCPRRATRRSLEACRPVIVVADRLPAVGHPR